MQSRSLIGKLQSPSFQAVAAIAQHAGGGMTVTRLQSIRFPTGTCQVWEFTPKLPPLDRPPVVVAVFLRKGKLDAWTPAEGQDYAAAVRHYTDLALECQQRAREQPTSPSAPAERAPAPAIVLPGMPAGVRVAPPASGKPLTIGGKPVVFAAEGGAP